MKKEPPEIRFPRFIQRQPNGCWLWTGSKNKKGYGQFCFNGKCVPAHRVAFLLWNGPLEDGQCALHTCDVRACVNPAHLWKGTSTQNNEDRDRKGRASGGRFPGALNPRAKLTKEHVAEIKRRYASENVSMRALAEVFSVSTSAVQLIISGKNWPE